MGWMTTALITGCSDFLACLTGLGSVMCDCGRVDEGTEGVKALPILFARGILTCKLQSPHCWLPRSAAQWSWWSLACELDIVEHRRRGGKKVNVIIWQETSPEASLKYPLKSACTQNTCSDPYPKTSSFKPFRWTQNRTHYNHPDRSVLLLLTQTRDALPSPRLVRSAFLNSDTQTGMFCSCL